jgi:hypothetical protein
VIKSPASVIPVQELALLEPGNACSNLCEEYYELFQLVFLLPLISPEYSFVSHFAQHWAYTRGFRRLSKFTVAHSADGHWHWNGHHVNVWHSYTWVFFMVVFPCLSSSIRNVCEGDLCSKTHNCMFVRCSMTDIFKCDVPTIHRNE